MLTLRNAWPSWKTRPRLAMSHDTFSHNTRNQLKQVFDALRELMT